MDYFFIGDTELVTAFGLVGIEGLSVRDSAEAAAVFRRITGERAEGEDLPALTGAADYPAGCRVLLITEEIAGWLETILIDWQISGRYPLIVEVPGIKGRLPGRKTLVDAIREAIGINV